MSGTCTGWHNGRRRVWCENGVAKWCHTCGLAIAEQPAPLPPMPPEVRRLVEWAEGAEAQMESDRGPSKTHPTEGEQIIAAVRRIFRSEP